MNTKIHTTTDYDQFKFLKENRPINQKHVDKLVQSMREVYLPVPILVVERNVIFPCLVVKDGQHRVMAAKECGYPIHYIIGEDDADITVDQIRTINETVRPWSMNDYLHSFMTTEEDPTGPYHTFDWFKKRYNFPFQINIDLLCNRPMQETSMSVFKKGKIEIKNLADAVEKADFFISLKDYTPLYHDRSFVLSLIIAMRDGRFNKEHFRNQLAKCRSELYKCNSATQYMERINYIYNYRTRGERMSFAVAQQGNGAYIKPNLEEVALS